MIESQLTLLERQYVQSQQIRREEILQLQHWEAQVEDASNEETIPDGVYNGLRSSTNIVRRLDARHVKLGRDIMALRLLMGYCEEIIEDMETM